MVAAQPPYGVLRTLDLPPVSLHFMYLWALPMRILQMFLQICLVAQCDMAVAGSAGLNAAGIMPKVHYMWVNSLAALLGALAAIRSQLGSET